MPDPTPPADLARLEQGIAAYTRPLVGARLPATTLPDLIRAEKMIILHFLRHLGCIFCKHSVRELRRVAEASRFPRIVFVHQSPVTAGEEFFNEYFPGSSHISDPALELYQLFGINRLEGLQTLNPAMYLVGFQSLMSGNRPGPVQGDVLVLSGTFLFNNARLVWSHRAKYAGDDPRWTKLAS